MRPPRWLIVVFVGALVGIVFAGVSTYDFSVGSRLGLQLTWK